MSNSKDEVMTAPRRGLMSVVNDAHRACQICSGGINSRNGRLACNLRNDAGELAPIDCVIPRCVAAIEAAEEPAPLLAIATEEFIMANIKNTGPFPPQAATLAAKKQAATAAPLVAEVSAQSAGRAKVLPRGKASDK
jgi:hypothetical protein